MISEREYSKSGTMAKDQPPKGYTDEYSEGRTARRQGVSVDDNPYPMQNGNGYKRQGWYDGWYDEKLQPLHSRLDARLRELKDRPRKEGVELV